jgi:hypothetical protein
MLDVNVIRCFGSYAQVVRMECFVSFAELRFRNDY